MILHIHLWCIFCSMIPTSFTPKMAQCAASTEEMNAGTKQIQYKISLPARRFFPGFGSGGWRHLRCPWDGGRQALCKASFMPFNDCYGVLVLLLFLNSTKYFRNMGVPSLQ